ncbi:acyl-CoA dehydrogenase family protein [Pseudooceanicola algae]|uniref:Flavin-dependent monooxygenase, oxygenase subunit HsaA n=1 Tax=Pseudooceanicola algae TaxID=1537215 RepID=A0A418SKY2_9RHOB|nr:acyl-CoA dehydrogenase family protein [Pseudooceanicola algae]QPM90931.1 Flavin-dependent monooxygenase, oxygenase subunit HsaA [Pseudooceanicola algae]
MTYVEKLAAPAVDFDRLTETPEFVHLLEVIEARRETFETLRHIPQDIVDLMKAARIFRSATPQKFGGDAMAPHHFLKMVDKIGTVDGSAAWVSAFGSANTYTAALCEEAQAVIYATGPDQVFAGGLHPVQKATRVEGGWKVSGRWKFASGCKGADWIGVGIAGDPQGAQPDAPPVVMMGVSPACEVEIIETWDVSGMQGTGSHDTLVTDKFYPDMWICERGAPGVIDEPLYRYPAMAYQAQVHAACNLGLARAAIEQAKSVSGAAKIGVGHARLCDRPYFLSGIAECEARLRGARAFFYEAAEAAWDSLLKGDPVSLEQNNMLRLSATNAALKGAEVVQQAYRIAGMGVISRKSPMQRYLRDAMVVTQHAAVTEMILENAGRVLAGLEAPRGYP